MNVFDYHLADIARKFAISGEIAEIKNLGPGFINDTLTVDTLEANGKRHKYILQRKNHNIFPDIPGMMHNIELVTSHIRLKILGNAGNPEKEVLTLIRRNPDTLTVEEIEDSDSVLFYRDVNGNYWTMCLCIEDSVTYEKVDSPELAYKGGVAIGKFQSFLADFDMPLNETIKGFHNMRWRFKQWNESLAKNKAGRIGSLQTEIGWIESRKKEMLGFWQLIEDGIIPQRVAHNDTKISNILFDTTGNVLCVIDLDTCMSSTSLNDYGDAIRSYTNTGAEDDPDPDNVSMSLDMFKAYTEGYMSQRKSTLSELEKYYLAFSARYITFEQVLRFLMDYIDGDIYYKISYPEHNIVRARAQYKLLCSIEEQYELMRKFIDRL